MYIVESEEEDVTSGMILLCVMTMHLNTIVASYIGF